MLCQAGERGEAGGYHRVGWQQPQPQADLSHPPHSAEKGEHNSLDRWLQLLSLADMRARHSARIHNL